MKLRQDVVSLAFILPLIAIAILVGLQPIGDHDLFWLLKTGEVIFTTHQIPKTDIFSYTAFGQPWCNLDWLSAVIFWLIYRLDGINGMIIYKIILSLLIAAFLYRTFLLFTKSHSISAWGVVITLLCIHMRIQARPHMITDTLTAFYILLIYRYIFEERNSLWILLPLQFVWVNSHLGAIFGIGILLAFTVGEWLQRFFPDGPAPIEASRNRHLLIVSLLAVIVSLLNPWGPASLTFPFENVFSFKSIVEYTFEMTASWDPLFDNVLFVIAFRLFFVITIASYILNRKHCRLSSLFMMIITSVMAFQASRLISLFFIVNAPLAFANLRDAIRHSKLRGEFLKLPTWMHTLIILNLIAFLMWHGIPVFTDFKGIRHMGTGIRQYVFPEGAVNFLEENDIHGRILNEMGEGGYLIFRRWPGELVHIDGRTPVFGDEFFRDHIDAFRNKRNFEDYLKKFEIDYILLDATEAPAFAYLHRYLWDNPQWKLVYASSRSLLYLKQIPKFQEIIQKYAFSTHPLFTEGP